MWETVQRAVSGQTMDDHVDRDPAKMTKQTRFVRPMGSKSKFSGGFDFGADDKPGARKQDEFRRAENGSLMGWNSDTFYQVWGATLVGLLIVYIFVVGPPTSDRCTLPWC